MATAVVALVLGLLVASCKPDREPPAAVARTATVPVRTSASSPTLTATATASPSPTATWTPSPTLCAATATPLPPSRVVSSAIGLDAPIVPVTWHVETIEGRDTAVWQVADGDVASWHETSARPGERGNVVVTGHSSGKGDVFATLPDLAVGDIITVWSGATRRDYAVVFITTVQEANATLEQRHENARWIGPFPDERLTLITCWPVGADTHRLVVVAKPVSVTRVAYAG